MKDLYNGTSAYNLNDYENYARTSEENRKERIIQKKKENISMCRFLIITLSVAFCIASAFVYTNVMMMRASSKTEKLKDELALITEQNKQAEMEINQKLDMKVIEEKAVEKLGMQRPDNSQIVYINVKQDTYTELADEKKNDVKPFASLKDALNGILEYFN